MKYTVIVSTGLLLMSCVQKSIKDDFISNGASTKEKVRILMTLDYGYITLNKTEEEKYYNALPNDFNEFKRMYGKPWEHNGRTLWLSFDFDLRLVNSYHLDKRNVLLKLFNISKNGYWEDSPAVDLQMVAQKVFAKNVNVACGVLTNYGDEDIIGFWRFYFDGPHPDNYQKDFEELYRRYRTENTQVAELMKKAYEELLLESDGHGH